MQKFIVAYKLWHGYWVHFDKLTRFGLGAKIEFLFIETVQHTFTASRKPRPDRLLYLNRASESFDLLKFLLQVMWELGLLDNKKYIGLFTPLAEIGRMLGGWQKQTKIPPRDF